MLRRRLLPAVAALFVAFTMSGCHEAFCGDPVDFDYVFELVGGVYRCKGVPEEPKPYAIADHTPEPALTGQLITLDGSRSHTPEGTIQSYAWDLDADGRFDDATGAAAETSFEQRGEHAVALRVRDSEGRRDRADIVIAVLEPGEAVPPIAVLDADSTAVPVGGTVTFDPRRSSDLDGRIVEYAWDLDGDGSYFQSSNVPDPEQHTYREAGTFTARLRVTDDDGLTGVAEQTITVSAGGTVQAAFMISPNPARPDQTVTFDASGSQGDVARYEWDLDGDGTYEPPSGTATTTHNYEGEAQPGDAIDVGLRVSNAAGTATSTATEELRFTETAGARLKAAAAGRPFRARLEGATYGRHRGVARASGRRLSIKRRVLAGALRGKLLGRGGAGDPLADYLRAGWLGRISMSARRDRPLVTLRGLAYARFERAPGSACVRLRLRARGRRRTGTLVALGGTGDGATLAARASFRWRFTRRGEVALRGRIRGGTTRPPRAPGRACASLRRLRP
jgi:PKD repeat protein